MLLYLKALHIIGVVVWFSGLFYLGRLFVYHQEALQKEGAEKQILTEQFVLMEYRLYKAITNPGMMITITMGLAMLYYWQFPSWLHLKLLFVGALFAYHIKCNKLRKALEDETCNWTSTQIRLFNEVPAILLISIVFIVVLKDQLSLPVLSGVLAVVTALIIGTIYKRRSLKNAS